MSPDLAAELDRAVAAFAEALASGQDRWAAWWAMTAAELHDLAPQVSPEPPEPGQHEGMTP